MALNRTYIYIYIYIYIVTSWLPPPYYHHHPVPYSPPFTRLPTGVGVWERRGAETARSGGVWWGTPEVNGASSPPLLYVERASPLETGLFPVHAHWCPRGSKKGAVKRRAPRPWDVWWARMPGRITLGSAAGQKEDEAAEWSRRPSRPGHERGARAAAGLRPLTWTPPSRTLPFLHDEDTRSPVYFGHFNPFGHVILLYFCWIKASPTPDATPTVSVVCSSRHNIYI